MEKNILGRKHAMVALVMATDSNPNGDRDNNGAPRVDERTGQGEMTDVCIKRHLKDTMAVLDPTLEQYIKNNRPLNEKLAEAAEANGMTLSGLESAIKGDRSVFLPVREYLLNKYFDLRAFGGLLAKLTQPIKGPVQFAIAKSVLPVEVKTLGLTSQGIPTAEKFHEEGIKTVMGEKSVVRHGLYVVRGEISAVQAAETGFTEEDKDLLLQAMAHMFDFDKSAARPDMRVCALYDFEYPDRLGLACHTDKLWEAVKVAPVPEVLDGTRPATKYSDYFVGLDEASIPEGVVVHKLV